MSRVSVLPVKISEKTGREPQRGSRESTSVGNVRLKTSARFQRGRSGNPKGRPSGSRNHNHLHLQELILNDAEAIIGRIVKAALGGDMTAARLLIDRLLPKRTCRPLLGLTLPAISTAADACCAMAAITNAAVEGVISTTEAADLSLVMENFRRIRESTDLEIELRSLKDRLERQGL